MVRAYGRWVGAVLVLLGLTGFVLPGVLSAARLPSDRLHNSIHLLSGVALVSLAYSNRRTAVGPWVTIGVQTFGIVYTLLGLLGLTGGGTVLGLFPVTLLYNLIHLAIGLLGMYAGFGREAANA